MATGIILPSAAEFFSSPAALFEVSPQLLTTTPVTVPISDAILAFCDPAATATKKDFVAYQTQLATLKAQATSLTAMTYHVGVIAQTALHFTILAVIFAFLIVGRGEVHRKDVFWSDASPALLGAALFFGSLWCVFRITYKQELAAVFTAADTFGGDFMAMGLYLVCFLAYIGFLWLDLDKLSGRFAVVLSCVTWVIMEVLAKLFVVSSFFGSTITLGNLITLYLLVFFAGSLVGALVFRSRILARHQPNDLARRPGGHRAARKAPRNREGGPRPRISPSPERQP